MSEILALQAASHFPAPRPLSLADARAHFSRLGMALRKTPEGEFRVNYRHGAEATAAYESTLSEAIATGLAMLAHRRRVERSGQVYGISARDVASTFHGAA